MEIKLEFSHENFNFSPKSGETENNEELEDIIKLVDSIRLGNAEKSQQMSIISRTISQVRKVKNNPDEANTTELAFLLQACRGLFYLN